MKIAIIGAGLIGRERIEAIQFISSLTNNNVYISSVFDTNPDTLAKVKEKYNVPIITDISSVGKDKPDWIFIATPNHVVYDLTKRAFNIGTNVLVEKPFGRSLSECDKIITTKPEQFKLNVGFNYRFFNGIEAALNDVKSGKFGKLISVNMILGHGNSPGMENSWKLDPDKCGNVSTDLTVHLFDLMLQISDSSIHIDKGRSWRGLWNTGIEEEAHLLAHNDEGVIFNAQVSLNRWRSTFRIEINGTEGYGVVENRGRSYGPQSYRTGKKWGWLSGKNQVDTEACVIKNDDCSDSFKKESISILGLCNEIAGYSHLRPACSHDNARKIMALLEEFEQNRIMI